MEELTLTTPALLFSAISLILLAYTNRFLSYAQLIRSLREQHRLQPSKVTRAQIDNLRLRLRLTRSMQSLGVASLFLCVVTMFLIYVGLQSLSAYVFGVALLCLIGSLGISLHEVRISVRALDIHLHDMEAGVLPVGWGGAEAAPDAGFRGKKIRSRCMTCGSQRPLPIRCMKKKQVSRSRRERQGPRTGRSRG